MQVVFYKNEKGEEPARDFLDCLDVKMQAKEGSDITRVLYFYVIGNKAVLTHGFVKKTNKTPPSEIERAIQYRNEYMKQFNTKADK